MMMAAADLLSRDAHPARRQVEDALGGVLCRCTGYLKIVEAVARSPTGGVDPARPHPAATGQGGWCRRASAPVSRASTAGRR